MEDFIMKKTKLIQLIIFTISFFEILLVILIPYCNLFEFFRVEGSNWWGAILILNGFILTLILLKVFQSKIKPSLILIWIIFGAVIFILPYSLVRLPWTILGLENLFNLLVGISVAYFLNEAKSRTKIIIISSITIIYTICYIVFIYDSLNDCFIVPIAKGHYFSY